MTHGHSKSKYWCFTVNNYTPEEEASLKEAVANKSATYVIIGREVGDTGTSHLQGYLELKSRTRLNSVKSVAGLRRAHLEPRKGTQSQAIDYCKKDNHFDEFGSPKVNVQGARNDLAAIQTLLDNGTTSIEVAQQYFGTWCRYRKSFEHYKQLTKPSLNATRNVHWIYGPTGTGKTRIVFSKVPCLWINSDTKLQWFDGYEGQSHVLLDDYRGEGSDAFILRLLDRYPLSVAVKGEFRQWHATEIYITSNLPADAMHPLVHAAFRRRIKTVTHIPTVLNFDDQDEIDRVWASIEG